MVPAKTGNIIYLLKNTQFRFLNVPGMLFFSCKYQWNSTKVEKSLHNILKSQHKIFFTTHPMSAQWVAEGWWLMPTNKCMPVWLYFMGSISISYLLPNIQIGSFARQSNCVPHREHSWPECKQRAHCKFSSWSETNICCTVSSEEMEPQIILNYTSCKLDWTVHNRIDLNYLPSFLRKDPDKKKTWLRNHSPTSWIHWQSNVKLLCAWVGS